MLFTWDTNNLCIVFRQWHIRSTLSLIVSLLLVVAITAGYEALRAASRRYEMKVNKKVDAMPSMLSCPPSLVFKHPFPLCPSAAHQRTFNGHYASSIPSLSFQFPSSGW